jgi:hypothetical protein
MPHDGYNRQQLGDTFRRIAGLCKKRSRGSQDKERRIDLEAATEELRDSDNSRFIWPSSWHRGSVAASSHSQVVDVANKVS